MAELDHRTLEWAAEIIGMCEPIRCVQGGMWFGRNHNMADATFVDYGAADAFAVAAKALPSTDRNWVEDAPHENGNYECSCVECGHSFIGHKRRVLCKLCSNLLAPSVPSTHGEGK